jgi:hypothetical protein
MLALFLQIANIP